MSQYGGVYRHPPAPQRQRPSAILPAEVFPNPPVGSRGRQIVMAIVAAQWIFVPQPQQRRPTVTESGAVVEVFVPQSRAAQNRTILEQWRPDPQPQQRRPVVTSDTPSVFIPKARDYDRVIADAWHVDPVPQRRIPTVTAGTPLFLAPRIDSTNNRLIVASWRQAPQPQQRRPVVTEGAVVEVFVPQSRVQDRLIVASWQTVPTPQRSRPTAILPAEVFPDPPTGQQRRQMANALVIEQWRYHPLPYQRPPWVTEGSVEAIPPIDGGVALPTLEYGGGVDAPTLEYGGGVAPPTIDLGGGTDGPSFE